MGFTVRKTVQRAGPAFALPDAALPRMVAALALMAAASVILEFV